MRALLRREVGRATLRWIALWPPITSPSSAASLPTSPASTVSMRWPTSSTWHALKRRTPTVTATDGGRLQPHLLHQRRVRVPVGDEAVLLLLGANEVAHLEVDMRGEAGLVVAKRGELLLHGDAVVAGKLGTLGRPLRLERPSALHQIGEVTDGQRIHVGVVVVLDDVEVR